MRERDTILGEIVLLLAASLSGAEAAVRRRSGMRVQNFTLLNGG